MHKLTAIVRVRVSEQIEARLREQAARLGLRPHEVARAALARGLAKTQIGNGEPAEPAGVSYADKQG